MLDETWPVAAHAHTAQKNPQCCVTTQAGQQSSQICNSSDHLPGLVSFIEVNMEHALHLMAVTAFTQAGSG